MRIKTKLMLLMAFCMAVFISLAAINKGIEKRRLGELFTAEEASSEAAFDKTIDLMGRSLEMFVGDYTRWSEMGQFLLTPVRGWAETNIDTSLETYKADAAWILGKDGSALYDVSGLQDGRLKDFPVPRAEIADLFAASGKCHIFAVSPAGPIEIHGSAIRARSDPQDKSGPLGYLFAARLWDNKYLGEIARLTGTTVIAANITNDAGLRHISDPAKGLVAFSRVMKGFDGRPVFRINILNESENIKAFTRASNQMMALIVVYSAFLVVVLWVSLSLWISTPLGKISDAVNRKRPIDDKRMLKGEGEFSDLAAIINRFYEHRERLTSEIVAHRSAESALRLSEEKFAKAFRANPNPMAIFTWAGGRFLDVNEAFLKITGHERKKVIDHTLEDLGLMAQETRYELVGMLEENGRVHDLEIEVYTTRGETRNWLFSASTIDLGDEKIVLAVANDISERKVVEKSLDETQRQLMQSEKLAALGRFASGLAHEVKNPLAILLGGVEFLRDKIANPEPEVREAMTKMREAVMRANIVVKDLLSFARPSRLVFEKVRPGDLVRDAIGFVELFKHKSDTADIEIRYKESESKMWVEVDRNQIQQVLFNILLNSIEAVSMKGEIAIKTYAEGPSCVIEVRDTGHGIAKSDLPKLFEPFFTTKRDRKGTGLGLSIVKSIVERHKGAISVDSEVGKGTVVKISLPAVKA